MKERKRRILVCEFQQETDTFNPIVMGYHSFLRNEHVEGEEAYKEIKMLPIAVHGMFDAIEEVGAEVVPTIFLYADAGGRVDDAVIELALDRIQYYVENAGEFDGVCAALHGATCTVREDDACGVFLKRLRAMVGDKPIAVCFDLHANVTKQVLEYSDVICGYQTYPHVDIYETGYRTAKMCLRLLDKQPLCQGVANVPMLVPPSGYSSTYGPFKEVIDTGHRLVKEGKLLDYSVFPVQPWLDISEISSVAVTIAEDTETAQKYADMLVEMLYRRRDEYMPDMMSLDDVIDLAEKTDTPKPVILADAADSPGAGAVGDSPIVAMRLAERGSKLRAGMFVIDPAAVKKAFEIGVGKTAEFSVGAGYTLGMPGPFKGVGRVRSLHDGVFHAEGAMNRGVPGNMGMSAVISFGTIDILVSETCNHTGDPQMYRHFGIEPTMYELIVVKANTSFREPYSAFAGTICYADTPGAGASNLKQFEWKNIPKGMYPFDK